MLGVRSRDTLVDKIPLSMYDVLGDYISEQADAVILQHGLDAVRHEPPSARWIEAELIGGPWWMMVKVLVADVANIMVIAMENGRDDHEITDNEAWPETEKVGRLEAQPRAQLTA